VARPRRVLYSSGIAPGKGLLRPGVEGGPSTAAAAFTDSPAAITRASAGALPAFLKRFLESPPGLKTKVGTKKARAAEAEGRPSGAGNSAGTRPRWSVLAFCCRQPQCRASPALCISLTKLVNRWPASRIDELIPWALPTCTPDTMPTWGVTRLHGFQIDRFLEIASRRNLQATHRPRSREGLGADWMAAGVSGQVDRARNKNLRSWFRAVNPTLSFHGQCCKAAGFASCTLGSRESEQAASRPNA
jgi:hypothetical protein